MWCISHWTVFVIRHFFLLENKVKTNHSHITDNRYVSNNTWNSVIHVYLKFMCVQLSGAPFNIFFFVSMELDWWAGTAKYSSLLKKIFDLTLFYAEQQWCGWNKTLKDWRDGKYDIFSSSLLLSLSLKRYPVLDSCMLIKASKHPSYSDIYLIPPVCACVCITF